MLNKQLASTIYVLSVIQLTETHTKCNALITRSCSSNDRYYRYICYQRSLRPLKVQRQVTNQEVVTTESC